jgi:nicotinate phosphoribosyltransferase
MKGVRIDSGDLAQLSKHVRRMLDEAGLRETKVLASGDLDEWRIEELLQQGAAIDGFGVGTRLVTGGDVPYLGGVYKLVSVERDGRWSPRLKLSSGKELYPGMKSVFRFADEDSRRLTHDLLAAVDEQCPDGAEPVHEVVLRGGTTVGETPSLGEIRDRAGAELDRLPAPHRRLQKPDPYPVEVSETLKSRFESISEEIQEGTYE